MARRAAGESSVALRMRVCRGYARVVLRGPARSEALREAVRAVAGFARRAGVRRILVDAVGLTGEFTRLARYEVNAYAAAMGREMERVAVVMAPAMIDPEKYGVQVARNRGLLMEVFTDGRKARAWLLLRPRPR
jgi:hypothetical protein